MVGVSTGVKLPVLGHVTLGGVIAGIIVGVILAPQIRRVPGIDRLPTA
jgi:hypothetical protein